MKVKNDICSIRTIFKQEANYIESTSCLQLSSQSIATYALVLMNSIITKMVPNSN